MASMDWTGNEYIHLLDCNLGSERDHYFIILFCQKSKVLAK